MTESVGVFEVKDHPELSPHIGLKHKELARTDHLQVLEVDLLPRPNLDDNLVKQVVDGVFERYVVSDGMFWMKADIGLFETALVELVLLAIDFDFSLLVEESRPFFVVLYEDVLQLLQIFSIYTADGVDVVFLQTGQSASVFGFLRLVVREGFLGPKVVL